MKVFNTALKVMRSNIIYITIYIFCLGFLGVFLAGLTFSDNAETEKVQVESSPAIALASEDTGELSQALESYLTETFEVKEIGFEREELQDAFAKSAISAAILIPQGFSEQFEAAIEKDKGVPQVGIAAVEESFSQAYIYRTVDSYLNAVAGYLSMDQNVSISDAIVFVEDDIESVIKPKYYNEAGPGNDVQKLNIFFKFSVFLIIGGVAVCAAIVINTFERDALKRRMAASPVRPLNFSLQILLGTTAIAFMTWAWVMALFKIFFAQAWAELSGATIAGYAVTIALLCLFGLSLAFILGGAVSDSGVNIVVNVAVLAASFLGGVWIPLEFAGEAVRTAAHFVPTFYYVQALDLLATINWSDSHMVIELLKNWGILLLFTAALSAIAFGIKRVRRRTSGV